MLVFLCDAHNIMLVLSDKKQKHFNEEISEHYIIVKNNHGLLVGFKVSWIFKVSQQHKQNVRLVSLH